MPVTLTGGVNDREDATTLPDEVLQEGTGIEYRVGRAGPHIARGRRLDGTVSSQTLTGLYYAGFDDGTDYLVAQGASYYTGKIVAGSSISFTAIYPPGTGAEPVTGTHVSGRHYLANGVTNLVVESGPTAIKMGMAPTALTLGLSLTQGSSNMTALTGLIYWATEYDANRGIESVAGATVTTGAFSSLDGVVVTVSGTTRNSNVTAIRLYRTLDGGAFPTGELLIGLTSVGAGTYYDQDTTVDSLSSTTYGKISIAGLEQDRDTIAPVLYAIGGPFQGSLLGFAVGDRRTVRFTPAGYPQSWPTLYQLALDTHRHDLGMGFSVVGALAGAFCLDSVHVIYRLPRDADTVFAASEMLDVVTDERGLISRRGLAQFTLPGQGPLTAFVARDGIWATNLSSAPVPLTDGVDWEARVSVANLSGSVLANDPANRRLIFIYRRAADTTHNTGIMHLDYITGNIRVTHPNHGPLSALTLGPDGSGNLSVYSTDARASSGQVYKEVGQDADASLLVDSSGSVSWAVRTKEFLPSGAHGVADLGHATWMHGAGSAVVTHDFYHNRRDSNPERKSRDWSSRGADDINLGRQVNSFSLRVSGTATSSFPIHWLDVEGLGTDRKGGEGGA